MAIDSGFTWIYPLNMGGFSIVTLVYQRVTGNTMGISHIKYPDIVVLYWSYS